jgi:glycosyltransferase involved in cell wall biosynthesis
LGVRADVRKLMRQAHILVMHSVSEGMPMVLLEAGAEAMPVVVTPAGSIPSIVDENRGWITNHATFSEVLARAIANPIESIRRGVELHHFIHTHHSIAVAAAAHLSLYTRLAGRTGFPRNS